LEGGVRKVLLIFGLLALPACSDVLGLIPDSGGQGTVSIPRVILNCQTSQCRANATGPLINVIVTTSSCTDPLFGGVVSSSTRSIFCNGTAGCYGEITSWVSDAGPTSAIPAGTYNICSCINYSGGGTPWTDCDTTGEESNVLINSSTGLQIISSWTDQ
jgi:hypothetical protein